MLADHLVVGAGVALSCAATHFALGLRRPRKVENLLFATMMVVLFPFQLVLARLHATGSGHGIVELERAGAALAVLLITLFAVFVLRYSGLRLHPAIKGAYLAASAAWLAYDLLSPFGLLLSSFPRVAHAARGGPSVIAPFPTSPAGLAWQAFNALTVIGAIVAGSGLVRKGGRRKGVVLIVGASLLLGTVLFDLLRNLLARTSWPYLGGFGIVAVALLIAVQLASEQRDNERRLARMVHAAIRLRDRLNTPLQTLRFGLEMMPQAGADRGARVDRLQRAVTSLVALGRGLEEERNPAGSSDPAGPGSGRRVSGCDHPIEG